MNETLQLIRKAQQGDLQAKQQVVEKNMGLVYSVVKRFRQNQSYEDLVQIGCVGLIKAINHFDFSFEVAFSTYAVPIILGEVKRYFRDEGQIKVSRSIKENAMKLTRIKDEFTQKQLREPTIKELMELSELEMMDITLALESMQYCTSLDSTVDQKDGSSLRLDEKIEEPVQHDIVLLTALEKEILNLEQREQLLLYYRYKKEYNQSKIAEILNLSQVQISRLENRIYQKLKQRLLSEE